MWPLSHSNENWNYLWLELPSIHSTIKKKEKKTKQRPQCVYVCVNVVHRQLSVLRFNYVHSLLPFNVHFKIVNSLFCVFAFSHLSICSRTSRDGYAIDVIDTFTKCKQCISILSLFAVCYLLFAVRGSFVSKWNVHEEHKEHAEQHNRAINANGFWCLKMSKTNVAVEPRHNN